MANNFNSIFGKRLTALRLRSGLTHLQICERSGIDHETLIQYEEGRLEPSLTDLAALAKALGINLVELMDFDLDD